ncbi:PREDICTED: fibrillin-2-like [Polistes dominula]|uniref:Fibrillin-2-like n=1 Tax=Polistes dominula TaxID=743375 RepID=A0ABM1JFI5_POLDO|nr:PREDICTED: fibrillin-2-like [Polistes dominula]
MMIFLTYGKGESQYKKMTRENSFQLYGCLVFLLIIQLLLLPREGIIVDAKMEARFEKCCGLGTSWAMENLKCEKFTGPVNGVPRIEQGLCLETVDICCVKTYHDQQCEKGKADARNGLACVTSSSVKMPRRGDYHRDCCEGCKLGILTGSMGQGCSFKTFSFGIPWDPAFLQCCYEALPNTTLATDASDSTFSSDSSTETNSEMSSPSTSMTSSISESSPSSSSFSSSPLSTDSTTIPTPPLDDICQLMKGLLCTDICIPTPESYYCACREGFTLLEDGKTCRQDLPTDRCKYTNPCEQRCTDTGVAVRCSCNPGFELADDKRSCIPLSTTDSTELNDIDEDNELSPFCPAGYRYDSTSQVCNDINECLERKIQCPGLCENTIGSYRCITHAQKSAAYEACPPGYQWDARTKVCTDIDECVVLPNVCTEGTHFCVNTPGSYSCLKMVGTKSCPAGFKFDKVSQICKDVDECAERIHSCLETEECRNIAGAYECDMKCHEGFVYSISFGSCIDLNECIESTMPCPEPGTQCVNTIGGYECKRSNNSISFGSSLNKTVRNYECPPGFKLSKNLTESCVDIDECSEQLHICESDERCLNVIGSYRCELLVYTDENLNDDQQEQEQQTRERSTILYSRGYKTGMQTTMPAIGNVNNLSCNSGYKFDEQIRQCVDVDECVSGTAVCGIGERCVNSMGTYECYAACLPGFKPYGEPGSNRKEDCRDIDECSLGLHTCKNSQVCRNTNGSYVCQTLTTTTTSTTTIRTSTADWTTLRTTINSRANRKQINDRQWNEESCGLGYRRDYETGQCIDIDECVAGPGCRDYERCHNTIGGYECSPLCSTGWYFNPTKKSCEDVDECSLGRHDCQRVTHQCINTNGSYHCQLIPPCQNGFKRELINNTCVDIDECSENLHNCRLEFHQYCVNKVGSYECLTRLPSCSSGYKYSLQSNSCEDVDECLTGEHTCDSRLSLRCVNLPGTYRCEGLMIPEQRPTQRPACPSGFRYHPRLKKCTDIDECSEGLDSCGEEICYNQPGGYSCAKAPVPITRRPPTTPMTPSADQKCLRGTKFVKNRGCVDIDECREIEDACSSNEQCINTMGSYICNCRTGFKRDNFTQACIDINECQLKEDSCLPTQRCDNTIGSYICIRHLPCGTGYTLNAATEICEDNDECLLGTHDCTAGYHCRNTIGSYRCDRNSRVTTPQARPQIATTTSTTTTTTMIPFTGTPNIQQRFTCPQGFEISGDKCVDINECEIIQHPCSRASQRCVNTIGSYKCISRVICGNGFTLDSTTGQHCVDIDECADNSHECSSEQICENRQGGYVCKCPPGYTDGPNKDCVDIDECSIYGSGICEMNSRCENTAGSYRCICDAGFESIGNVAGGMCQDIDECQRTPGLCQHYCKNVWGSYRCGCKPGFRLNADNRSCTDIDECEEFKENNLCIGICENTPGSYSCKCPDGYRLGSDGRTCQDIDECSTGQGCSDPNDTCQNIRGGFKCNKIHCPSGYVKDHERRNRCVRASRFCKHNDYTCFRMPSYYSFNYITFVSMFPIPDSGSIELFTMRGTYQPGSNVQFTMAFVDVRAPPGITRATESCFALRRPLINQSVLVMTQSIQGPQEIELDLSMEIYHNSIFVGSAVAKLFIYVSQYEY